MRIQFHRVDGMKFRGGTKDYLTVGYWYWSLPNNKGTLHVEVQKLPDWRFELAVWLHECIEALYCKIFHVTTEECDKFDDWMEDEYESGRIPESFEGGCHRDCPYHWGHQAGIVLEYLTIYGTFASWKKYERSCNAAMNISG